MDQTLQLCTLLTNANGVLQILSSCWSPGQDEILSRPLQSFQHKQLASFFLQEDPMERAFSWTPKICIEPLENLWKQSTKPSVNISNIPIQTELDVLATFLFYNEAPLPPHLSFRCCRTLVLFQGSVQL